MRGWDVGGVLGVQQRIKKRLEQILNSLFFYRSCVFFTNLINVLYIRRGKIPGQKKVRQEVRSVTECKTPKKKNNGKQNEEGVAFDLLTWTAWWGEGTPLKITNSFRKNQSDPKSSTVLSNVSLSVGAPVRVYLHSLVRRLLYSHLTPSTLSSPSLPPVLSPPVHSHPDTPPFLLLPHRSMGDYVWCYDQCMSAALPVPPPSSGGRGSEAPRCTTTRVKKRPHLQRKSQSRPAGRSAQTLLPVVWISAVNSYTLKRSLVDLRISHCTNTKHTHIVREYVVFSGVWLDLCWTCCGRRYEEDSLLLFHCRAALCCEQSLTHLLVTDLKQYVEFVEASDCWSN